MKLWVEFMLPSAVPIFLVWGEERCFLFNPTYSRLLGPRYLEALGKPIRELWAPIWPSVRHLVDDVFRGNSAVLEDYPLKTWKSGFTDQRYFNLSYSPIVDLSKQVVGAICIVADATQRVRSRQQILEERDALHELYEQAPGFIAIVRGPEHRFIFANASYRQLVGHREIVGRTVAEVLPEIVEQGFIDILDNVYRSGEPFVANGLPIKLQRSPGADWEERLIDTVYQPFRDAAGDVVGIFAEGHDVTEQALAHKRIEALQTELLHVSRIDAMGTMGAALAHELNQPLTAIVNYLAAARRIASRSGVDPLLLETLVSASDAAYGAGEIIRRLRSLTTRGSTTKEIISLRAAIEQAADLFLTANPQATLRYSFNSSDVVEADRVHIQQVVLNLLQNAYEAKDSNGQGKWILTVRTKDKGDLVEVCVSDNGPGIALDVLPNIFDTFATTKAEGMGIGLPISRTIVEAHGGKIEARNNADGGASVCFSLPRLPRTKTE